MAGIANEKDLPSTVLHSPLQLLLGQVGFTVAVASGGDAKAKMTGMGLGAMPDDDKHK
jgi:hypothetical protein